MESFRGYPVRREAVVGGGRTYELVVPLHGEALLDDPRVAARFDRDEYMPYWAMLWPAALLLADVVAAWPQADPADGPQNVLDLGCGLGLVGLVAAERGYRVTVCDYDEDALAFAVENARRNGAPVHAARRVDWHTPYEGPPVDRIVAADVLYEARNLRPVAEFVRRQLKPDGFALLSDPNRRTADAFGGLAAECGLSAAVTNVERLTGEAGVPIRGRIYHLRHAAARVS